MFQIAASRLVVSVRNMRNVPLITAKLKESGIVMIAGTGK
jgi:hypothetical protein